jgi:hypothetical protein
MINDRALKWQLEATSGCDFTLTPSKVGDRSSRTAVFRQHVPLEKERLVSGVA